MTPEQEQQFRGIYRIKCTKAGGLTLTGYGAYAFSEDEEMDLTDPTTPETLRALDASIAHNMCTEPTLELAQLIVAGHLEIIEVVMEDYSMLGGEQA